jgi:hypothetical protein
VFKGERAVSTARKVSDETINRYVAGKAYIEAGKMIFTSPHYEGPRVVQAVLPLHMLAAFALELLFKAWLLGTNRPSKQVKAFGHDIEGLFKEAQTAGLPAIPKLDELVDLFSAPHADFTYRYLEKGTTITTANWHNVFPLLDQLETAVDAFVGASAEQGLVPGH